MKLLIALALLALSGCDPNDDNNSPQSLKDAVRPLIIKTCNPEGVVLVDATGQIFTYNKNYWFGSIMAKSGAKAGDTLGLPSVPAAPTPAKTVAISAPAKPPGWVGDFLDILVTILLAVALSTMSCLLVVSKMMKDQKRRMAADVDELIEHLQDHIDTELVAINKNINSHTSASLAGARIATQAEQRKTEPSKGVNNKLEFISGEGK